MEVVFDYLDEFEKRAKDLAKKYKSFLVQEVTKKK